MQISSTIRNFAQIPMFRANLTSSNLLLTDNAGRFRHHRYKTRRVREATARKDNTPTTARTLAEHTMDHRGAASDRSERLRCRRHSDV